MSLLDMAEGPHSTGLRRVSRHYFLLLWKNIILAKRTPIRTFLEITLPVFFGFLLLAIRYIVKSETFTSDTIYPSFSVNQLPSFTSAPISMIAFTPQTTFTNAVMKRAAGKLNLYRKSMKEKRRIHVRFACNLEKGFDDEQTLIDQVNKGMPASIYLGGVVFTNLTMESDITYKIRLSAKLRNSGAG